MFGLGCLIVACAGGMLLPAIIAFSFGENETGFQFIVSSVFSIFIGGALIVALWGVPRRASLRENLFLVVLGWMLVPVFGALPFLMSGIYGGFINGYFEAISGLTTTGATVLTELQSAPKGILVWRAVLQWLGGFGSIIMAISVLSTFNASGFTTTHRMSSLPGEQSTLDPFVQMIIQILIVYSVATFSGFLVIWISDGNAFLSFCIALSAISTGGFVPSGDAIEMTNDPLARTAIAVLMLYGATSFLVHWAYYRGHRGAYFNDPEVRYFFIVAGSAACILAAATINPDAGLAATGLALGAALFHAISIVTTTGFWISDDPWSPAIPVFVVMSFAFIGASFTSTAGGLHIMRLALLLKQSGQELFRLAFPHGVGQGKYGTSAINYSMLSGVWAVFAAAMAAIAVCSCILAATGLTLEASLVASVSALSNVGPLYDISAQESYASMAPFAKLTLCGVMIVGRIELLVIMSLFNPAFWRN